MFESLAVMKALLQLFMLVGLTLYFAMHEVWANPDVRWLCDMSSGLNTKFSWGKLLTWCMLYIAQHGRRR